MKNSKSIMKTLVSSTFSFLLTLLFFTLFVCIGLSFGIFGNKSIISKINETKYYDKVYVELNKRADEIILQAALPVTVLDDVITLDRVYVGGNNYINGTLKGEKPQINTDKLRSNLQEHIDQYLTQQAIEKTDEVKALEDNVITRIEEEYLSGVELKFIDYFVDFRTSFGNVMKLIIPLSVVLACVLCVLLIRLHKNRHRGLRYINYALISSSLLLIIASFSLLISKGYEKLNVMPAYYRDFLIAYFKWDIQVFLYIGCIGILISAALVSLTKFFKDRANKG